MVAYNRFNSFVEDLAEKVHNLGADTLRVMLTNTLPVNTNTIKANITEITAGNGYVANGEALLGITSAQTSGVYKLATPNDTTWTATGTVGPFQYVVLYNDTPTSPADPLIAFWNYGSAVTLAATETFTVDYDATNGILQITSP